MHIHRMATLQALVDLAAFNPNVALGVKDLTIILPAGPQAGDAVQAIRRALWMTPNLERLVLNLAFAVPDYALTGISFPVLKSLSTNISHTALPTFLHQHPSLVTLSLSFIISHGIEYVNWPRLIPLDEIIHYDGPGFRKAFNGRGFGIPALDTKVKSWTSKQRKLKSRIDEIEMGSKIRVD